MYSINLSISPTSPLPPPPLSLPTLPLLPSSLSLPRIPISSHHTLRIRARQGKVFSGNTKMTIEEIEEVVEEDEVPPPLLEANSRPRRIALFVEPSPFAYVSGYKNRFQNFIKYLREMGDEVIVVTTHEGVPQEFHGAKLIGSWRDLQAARVTAANKIRLWNKGVDSESFHPRFRDHEMRLRLTDGEPEKPLVIHVGRLGVEKSLDFLKGVMDRLPGVRIAFIGDGPYKPELERMFSGMPAVFTGMLHGEELSKAYASGDVFIMPSESETLGLVVLEAMSSGVPVVGVRAGGIPDIIPEDQDGKTGFLYAPGDMDDCVNKVEQLLSCTEFRETMGRAAREEMEKYDWRAATKKIRNEQYNAAIWFWQKKRAQLLGPIHWLFRRLFRAPEVSYS
ncbi:hypothetical protein QJS04_geneDACA007580 [Acorus gramineus]|uniref:Glycosyl transferase family 1 domain-containing protein n=1 Tax=Acorus gramineus TaxID=55184 RepID=A0AAV9B0M7_ACOGR|nr:hypothetical protein QJS04_geneDACA007580 [Acorus gramineus]